MSTGDPSFAVGLIDVFTGSRHDRLREIWRGYARWKKFPLRLVPNPTCVRHDVFLGEVWRRLRACTERFLIVTEADFLPSYTGFPNVLPGGAMLVEHAQRNELGILTHTGMPGAWYMAFDRGAIPCGVNPLFRAPVSTYHDPGNDLGLWCQAKGVPFRYMPGKDCWPAHWGIQYDAGTHLFWSRHLHDDPNEVVCGFKLGTIQEAHDRAVTDWLVNAPADLRKEIFV